MKTLVVGGAGFVGQHVVRVLLKRGDEVTVVDNCSRGQEANVPSGVALIKQDARRLDHTPFQGKDVVYDFAARVYGVRDLYAKPADLLVYNLETTINLLRCAATARVPQYVFVSSSCVYDFPGAQVPHQESDVGICNTSYGLCKMVGEELCRWYAAQFGLRVAIARLFNVYGPGDSFQSPHVIPEFMRKAWEISKGYTRTFPILGSGNQTRDFTWVEDAALGILAVADRGRPGEAYNLGTGHGVTIRYLAEMVLRSFGLEDHVVGIAHEDAPPQDIQQRRAGTQKAWDHLEWSATTRLADGLQRVRDHLVPLFEAQVEHPSTREEEMTANV